MTAADSTTQGRDTLIARVQALRARAADEASSEAEAAAAAGRAAKIIQENELTETDLATGGAGGISEQTHGKGRSRRHPALAEASQGIAALSECASYIQGGGGFLWAGQPSDVEFAMYLSEMIQGAAERAWKSLRTTNRTPHARSSYLRGFGRAIAYRLTRMAIERKQARQAATGTDLVVLKDQLISEHMTAEYGKIPECKTDRRMRADARYAAAGARDAEEVNLDRPISDHADRRDALPGART